MQAYINLRLMNGELVRDETKNVSERIGIVDRVKKLKLKGIILIGERKKVNSIAEIDYITGDMQLTIPLQLILPSQKVKSEIRTVNLSEEMQDLLDEWIVSGLVVIKIINHLPFAPYIKILISDDEDSVYNSTDLQLGPIKIGRAKTDSLSGKVIASVEEKSEIRIVPIICPRFDAEKCNIDEISPEACLYKKAKEKEKNDLSCKICLTYSVNSYGISQVENILVPEMAKRGILINKKEMKYPELKRFISKRDD